MTAVHKTSDSPARDFDPRLKRVVNAVTARRILDHGCVDKVQFSAKTARAVAVQMRADGIPVHPYRCPVCHTHHVGHVPSLASLESIALAMRTLAGNARRRADPAPPGPTLSRSARLRKRAIYSAYSSPSSPTTRSLSPYTRAASARCCSGAYSGNSGL